MNKINTLHIHTYIHTYKKIVLIPFVALLERALRESMVKWRGRGRGRLTISKSIKLLWKQEDYELTSGVR